MSPACYNEYVADDSVTYSRTLVQMTPKRRRPLSRAFVFALIGSLSLPLVRHIRIAQAAPGNVAPAPTPSAIEQRIAQQHYQNGAAFFEAQNYAAARTEFEAAYQLTHYPDLLYNLAQVAEKQNRFADEEHYWQEYLATHPKDAAQVRTRLAQLRELHPVDPGRLPPAPALGLLSGGAAALIIGIACGGAAISAAHTVSNPANSGKPFTADLFATQQRGQQLSSAAIALDVIGGTALAAGGAWVGYWLYRKHKANKPALPKTALLPQGLGIALLRSF